MKSKGFHPTEIIFSTTTACNLHCEHCFINRTPHKLEIADAVRLIESCVESGGQPGPDGIPLPVIDRIGFSGGEPFLYMDFLIEVTKAAITHDLMFDQIMTNGDWWRDEAELCEKLQTLYDAGYDGKIGLSWDSYHGQTTDRMETFIRTVQDIFGEDSINIQRVEDENAALSELQNMSLSDSNGMSLSGSDNVSLSGTQQDSSLRGEQQDPSLRGAQRRGNPPFDEWIASRRTPTAYLSRNDETSLPLSNIPVYTLPRTYTSEDPRAWQARRWFKEDYCQGPGNILYVHADGNIAPCCGFANENPALFIGRITDNFETIMQNATTNPMIKICYEEGLSHYRRHGLKNLLRSKKEKLPGKCSDICSFCDYVCKKCN